MQVMNSSSPAFCGSLPKVQKSSCRPRYHLGFGSICVGGAHRYRIGIHSWDRFQIGSVAAQAGFGLEAGRSIGVAQVVGFELEVDRSTVVVRILGVGVLVRVVGVGFVVGDGSRGTLGVGGSLAFQLARGDSLGRGLLSDDALLELGCDGLLGQGCGG